MRNGRRRRLLKVCFAAALVALAAAGAAWAETPQAGGPPWEVRVLVLKYFPIKSDRIDIAVTGDWGETLAATREKAARLTGEVAAALTEGSRYHAYKNPGARPSLRYVIVETREFLAPLPVRPMPGAKVPMTDYNRIMADVGIKDWVEQRGVREVWIWGYHGGVVGLWESNMAGPWGDISNSSRDPKDLPVLAGTYTVYHYNYQRGASEAVEDHIHQIEAVLNHVDGRDRTPPERFADLLFWGKFVGSDRTGKIVRPGCGWSHYPPNAEKDYDWANKRTVQSDIEDWKPDGTGVKQPINCDRWGGDSLRWFIFWMQSLPGEGSSLSYQGKPLENWWTFIGDFDRAMREGRKLTAK